MFRKLPSLKWIRKIVMLTKHKMSSLISRFYPKRFKSGEGLLLLGGGVFVWWLSCNNCITATSHYLSGVLRQLYTAVSFPKLEPIAQFPSAVCFQQIKARNATGSCILLLYKAIDEKYPRPFASKLLLNKVAKTQTLHAILIPYYQGLFMWLGFLINALSFEIWSQMQRL